MGLPRVRRNWACRQAHRHRCGNSSGEITGLKYFSENFWIQSQHFLLRKLRPKENGYSFQPSLLWSGISGCFAVNCTKSDLFNIFNLQTRKQSIPLFLLPAALTAWLYNLSRKLSLNTNQLLCLMGNQKRWSVTLLGWKRKLLGCVGVRICWFLPWHLFKWFSRAAGLYFIFHLY